MNHLLAQATVPTIFGKLSPPPGCEGWCVNPIAGLGSLIVFLIQIFLFVAAIALLIYLLWGAFDWITSNGEAEKLAAARQKMTNAVLGIVLILVALGIFVLVTSSILKIMVQNSDGQWIFKLPTINK